MKIVFFGSSQFGLPALEAMLKTGHRILCVVTQPDRPKGRGLPIAKTLVKEFSEKHSLGVFQPEDINTPEAINFLKKFGADLFVVIAYGQILSQGILDLPKIMCLNAHASLLPAYRGAAPVNWAIINGENNTGVTIIKLAEKMDAGPVILKKETLIGPQDTAITLENKLFLIAAELAVESIKRIENNTYELKTQDEKMATFAPKLTKKDGLIDWKRSAEEINNQIKGCLDWPVAFTHYHGKLLKIFKAETAEAPNYKAAKLPGEVLEASKDGISVETGKGQLIIKELQLEGKRRMSAAEFLSGHKLEKSCIIKAS